MSPAQFSRIEENVQAVRQRIARSAARSRRADHEVRLVAVTKYAELDWVRALIDLGVLTLGESRPQQFAARVEQISHDVEWHFVGHLQRNKAKLVVPHATLIHSVDSRRLLERISQIAMELGVTSRVLLEVNVSGEATKDGFSPKTVTSDWERILGVPGVQIAGLMTMAPAFDDPEQARPCFQRLRQLSDELSGRSPQHPLPDLSMGMSGDFEVAIEEGATLIRVGSALFEGLSEN